MSGEDHLRIEQDLGNGYVRLHVTEAQRRQAAQDIHCSENILLELLRNSKDAHARHIFVALSRDADTRAITVIDDGDGIPLSMHERIFEPRVTSKLDTSHKDAWGFHGRGMALYSVSENAISALVMASDVDLGASIRVVSDTKRLPERSDQSTFPQFQLSSPGKVDVRGPRNLLRTACEFALDARQSSALFIGSPSEIAATLYAYGESTLSAIDRAFCKDASELPLTKRLATAATPGELASLCDNIGLDLSERTARRIMDGKIAPLQSVIDLIHVQPEQPSKTHKKSAKHSAIRLQDSEKGLLAKAASAAFRSIADAYYLEPDVKPTIKVGNNTLTIAIPLAPSTEAPIAAGEDDIEHASRN